MAGQKLIKVAAILKTIIALAVALITAGCTTTSVLQTAPFEIPSERFAAIVVEENTGKVLYHMRADAIRFPASLTKMMTMYMVFERLKSGKITKSTPIPISSRAARQPASKLYLKAGSSITVDKALEALAVKSANDVAYATGEFISGSESAFARAMTSKARSLGLSSTTFRNASGLPDKRQVTTARDMAKLGVLIRRNFPQYAYYFKKSSMTYRGKTIRGHNKVLLQLRGADGMKTGYTRASGFNLVTSAKTPRGRLIGVILGENSSKSRDSHMIQLINKYGRKSLITASR
ncbi:MAG: D-alanyl-D-alanine carboxypeptidase family protein [Rhizobiaceae bacterium]